MPDEEAVVGKARVNSTPFTVTAGQERWLSFTLDFTLEEIGWDSVINEGGVLGTLGKIVQAFDDDEPRVTRSYQLIAAADVVGCKFDPKVTKSLVRDE